jgi:hypothetical protein
MLFVQVLRFSVQKLSTVSDVLTSVTRTPLVPTNQQLHVQFQELKHSLVGAVLRPLVSVIGRILQRKNTSSEEYFIGRILHWKNCNPANTPF